MAVKKSGVPGVTWDKRMKKWMAYLYKKDKTKYLGSFKNVNDAIKVLNEAKEREKNKVNKRPVSISKMKCRNRNCQLNENLFCGSPCRDWIEFTCASKDIPKKKEKKINGKTLINRTLQI